MRNLALEQADEFVFGSHHVLNYVLDQDIGLGGLYDCSCVTVSKMILLAVLSVSNMHRSLTEAIECKGAHNTKRQLLHVFVESPGSRSPAYSEM